MSVLFADTFFYLALLNANDAAHERAVAAARAHHGQTVTTSWILTEVFDALSRVSHRLAAVSLWQALDADHSTMLIPPDDDLFRRGIELYKSRPDKDWSLTDCISFVVMQDHDIQQALTGDHHFTQAGFRVLL